jgi:alkylhydroperoxidase family enzyme
MIGRPVADPRTARPGKGASFFEVTVVSYRFEFRSTTHGGATVNAATQTTQRIAPLEPPYEPEIARTLERLMPQGVEPLKLFRTVAVNHAVLERFRSTGAYLLNFGTVDPADREVVIHRTCALCGCEYEWGVHATVFGRPLGFTDAQLAASVHGDASDPAWSDRQRLLVRLCDELHRDGRVGDALWNELAAEWTAEQLVELLALAGFYHLVSYLANSCGVALEEAGERFPVK